MKTLVENMINPGAQEVKKKGDGIEATLSLPVARLPPRLPLAKWHHTNTR
jgi:hypothetical protein